MSERAFEICKIVLDKGLLALVALVGGFWLKKWQEDRAAQLERQHIPRTEIDLECRFFGPQAGEFLVEVSMRVNNIGKTRRKFKSMRIRLRGILAGEDLRFWDPARGGRVEFPMRLVKDDLLLGGEGEIYYYVEPQVRQVFTYVTKIPADVAYVLAHIKFIPISEKNEDAYENEFTEERVFEVPHP